jgi:DNA-directed RNA polymerase specialized sigma24 family protein
MVLQKALEDLSLEQREMLRLCFFEGHTLEKVAVHLDLSYGNVRHHLLSRPGETAETFEGQWLRDS